MLIISQNGIRPTTKTNIKAINDLRIKEFKYDTPIYVVEAVKQTRYRGLIKRVALASFYIKKDAENLLNEIKAAIEDDRESYSVPGDSVWEGYEEELIPGIRREEGE